MLLKTIFRLSKNYDFHADIKNEHRLKLYFNSFRKKLSNFYSFLKRESRVTQVDGEIHHVLRWEQSILWK